MLVEIGSYDICDGTLSGGVAVSDLRLNIERGFDIVIPVGEVSPVLLDRLTSKSDITFTVKRAHGSLSASEDFLLELEENLPRSGNVKLTTTNGTIRYIPNGFVVSHNLSQQIGSTTFHNYHIIGGPTSIDPVAPPPPPSVFTNVRWVYDPGPPSGLSLQIKNSSDVWETIFTYHAST